MLVNVVRLRLAGAPIPTAQAKAASGMRGYLHFAPHSVGGMIVYEAKLTAVADSRAPALIVLKDAFVKKIEGASVLILGTDEDGHQQAWWCKVVSPPASGAAG